MTLQHSPSIVTNGLLWCLDAGNKRSYPGSGTSWSDLSGNGRTATLYKSPTFSNTNGGIFSFNGLDHHAGGPTDIKWTPDGSVGYTTLTIEIWVRSTDTAGRYYSKPWNSNGVYNIWIDYNTFYVGLNTVAGTLLPTATNDNNWRQIVGWVNSTQIGAYMNGTIVKAPVNHNLTGGVPTAGGGDVDRATALMNYFPYGVNYAGNAIAAMSGDMASVKVYNRVLTANEVRQNFNALRGRFGI